MRWLLVLPLTGIQIAARLVGVAMTVVDSFRITGSSDATKTLRFECDAQTAGADLVIDTGAQTVDRTITIPVLGGNRTFAVIDQAQTFSGIQTFSTAIASTSGGTGVSNAGTITNASNTTITGGGTLALGGFTLTAPATGTAALRGSLNTFTLAQTISDATASTSTSTGALIVTGGVGVGGAVWAPNYNISGTSGAGFKLTTASGYGFVTLNGDVTFSGTCGFFGGASGDSNMYILAPPAFSILMRVNNNTNLSVDDNATGGNTRLSVWDVTAGSLKRVSIGAADSGGAGFKVLRIPN